MIIGTQFLQLYLFFLASQLLFCFGWVGGGVYVREGRGEWIKGRGGCEGREKGGGGCEKGEGIKGRGGCKGRERGSRAGVDVREGRGDQGPGWM